MKVEALLLSVPQKEPRKEVALVGTSHSVIKIPPKSEGPAFEVVAVLDPTTRAAQKYTPLIMVGYSFQCLIITLMYSYNFSTYLLCPSCQCSCSIYPCPSSSGDLSSSIERGILIITWLALLLLTLSMF